MIAWLKRAWFCRRWDFCRKHMTQLQGSSDGASCTQCTIERRDRQDERFRRAKRWAGVE